MGSHDFAFKIVVGAKGLLRSSLGRGPVAFHSNIAELHPLAEELPTARVRCLFESEPHCLFCRDDLCRLSWGEDRLYPSRRFGEVDRSLLRAEFGELLGASLEEARKGPERGWVFLRLLAAFAAHSLGVEPNAGAGMISANWRGSDQV